MMATLCIEWHMFKRYLSLHGTSPAKTTFCDESNFGLRSAPLTVSLR